MSVSLQHSFRTDIYLLKIDEQWEGWTAGPYIFALLVKAGIGGKVGRHL